MAAKDSAAQPRTRSQTPPSVSRDSPNAITSPTNSISHAFKVQVNDADHPPDRTLWLGDLEPWMDDHYMVQICTLFGWGTSAIHIPRPPAAPNATRHPNNAGYCLLIFPDHEKALAVIEQYGADAQANTPTGQPVLLPNSNHPVKLDWLTAPSAKSAIGQEPGPIDNAIEYSIFVGDIAADVTNADLMNVFRNPNLGLRGDFPPRLIAPFLSCCNAKVMVDSVTGISKGYGFVRFTSETDQKRALLEMQGLYCKSRPMRLSTATAKNKNVSADEEHPEHIPVVVRPTPSLSNSRSDTSIASPSSSGPIPPSSLDPNRVRSITAGVADQAASKPSEKNEFSPVMLAKIAQLSNTMGQHYPAYRAGANGQGPVLPPPGLNTGQISQWLVSNPQARQQLETLLGGNEGNPPSDPLNTTVFVGGLSPLISEDTLRTFFAPFGPIHYVKVPPGKSCGFVQFVRKADAERAIDALSGFSIGGSKVRLSWGRIPAAQGAAQAAAAAAAAAANTNQHGHHNRSAPSAGSGIGSGSEGPLSSEQALHIVERLVPALMAAAGNGSGAGYGASPSPAPGGRGLAPAQMHGRPPLPGYRDPFGYGNAPGLGQTPGYMHGGGVSPYGHPGRVEYGRDYYYDVPTGGGYGSNLPYGLGNMGPMSPAMGMAAMRYGPTANASVLEDQLLGTYGGGIHRLQSSSVRQGSGYGDVGGGGGYGAGGAGYGAVGAGGYGGGLGGYAASEYEDLAGGGYRSQSAGGTGTLSGPASAGGYGSFGGFGHGVDLNDRLAGRMGPFTPTSASGLNGFGMNGLTAPGATSGGGSGGGTSPSRYSYGDDGVASPQFPASDILRQDASGLAGYLASNNSSGASSGTGNSGSGPKPNGHPRGPNAGLGGVKEGVHDLTGMFSSLNVGGTGGQKTPISPSSATGTGYASQHSHFRDSGRFN